MSYNFKPSRSSLATHSMPIQESLNLDFSFPISIAELRKHGLLLAYVRSRVLDSLIEEVQITDEDYNKAEIQWLAGKSQEEAKKSAWELKGLTLDDVKHQITRDAKAKAYASSKFKTMVPTVFIEQKDQWDRVSFSSLIYETLEEATSSYLALENDETSFEEMSASKNVNAKFYNAVNYSGIPASISRVLRNMNDNDVSAPLKLGKKFAIIHKLSTQNAVLDTQLSEQICLKLLADMVTKESIRMLGKIR